MKPIVIPSLAAAAFLSAALFQYGQDLPPHRITLYDADAIPSSPAEQGWTVFNTGPTGTREATVIDARNAWGITGTTAGQPVGNGHYAMGIPWDLLRDGETGELLPWALELTVKIGDTWVGAGGGNDFAPIYLVFQPPTSGNSNGNRTWNISWANDPNALAFHLDFLNQSAVRQVLEPTAGAYSNDHPFRTITLVMDPTGNAGVFPNNPELLSYYVDGNLVGTANYWTTSRFANPASHGGIDYTDDGKARLLWGGIGGSTGPSENWFHSIHLYVSPDEELPEPGPVVLFPHQKVNLFDADKIGQAPADQGWTVFNDGPTGTTEPTVIDGKNAWGITGTATWQPVGNGNYQMGIPWHVLRDGETGELLPWALEFTVKIGDTWAGAGGGDDYAPIYLLLQPPTSGNPNGNRTWNISWANDPDTSAFHLDFLNQSAVRQVLPPTAGAYSDDHPFRTITLVMDPTGNSAVFPDNPELLSYYVDGKLVGTANYWTTSRFSNPPGSYENEEARLVWGGLGSSYGPSENWFHSIDFYIHALPTDLPPLRITKGDTEDSLVVSWESEAGISYELQKSTDLVAWDPIEGIFTGDGTVLEYPVDLTEEGPRVFFRLVKP